MLQIAQRHFNAHAFVNMAIFLDVQETASNGHKGLQVQQAHVSIGFDQLKGTLLAPAPLVGINVCSAPNLQTALRMPATF